MPALNYESRARGPATEVVPHPMPAPPPTHDGERQIYAEGPITVTDARIIIYGKTYALQNVTSVSMRVIAPEMGGAIGMSVIGVICGLIGMCIIGNADKPGGGWLMMVIAAGAIAAGIWFFVSAKDQYALHLATSSGETDAITSKSRMWIEQMVTAVNKAIVARR